MPTFTRYTGWTFRIPFGDESCGHSLELDEQLGIAAFLPEGVPVLARQLTAGFVVEVARVPKGRMASQVRRIQCQCFPSGKDCSLYRKQGSALPDNDFSGGIHGALEKTRD